MFYIRKVIHVDRILNKCPKCGSKLQFSNLMQFTRDYTIKRNGRLSAKSTRSDDCPMDASFVACTSCDLLQIATENIKIMREEYKYIAKMA